MTLILTLFAIGLILFAVEVIIPGGIIGSLGALVLLGATILSFVEYGPVGGGIALVASIVLGVATLFLTFFLIRKTPMGRRAFLKTSISATSSSSFEKAERLIGKSAEAVTRLSPTGMVVVDDESYEAFCQNGQVASGTALKVVGADNFRLIVSPTTTS